MIQQKNIVFITNYNSMKNMNRSNTDSFIYHDCIL